MKAISFIAILSIVFLISSCDLGTPDDPGRTNPFDAHNPDTHGDPYRLEAELADGGVRLTWQPVSVPGLAGFSIYRNEDSSAFSRLLRVADTILTYTDRSIVNAHRYAYYVVFVNASGEGEASNLVKVVIHSDPVLFIEGENVTETPSRNVTLTILAYGALQMLISNSTDFAEAVWEPFQPVREWRLTTGQATKTVYLKVLFPTGDTSGVVFDQINPAPLSQPILLIEGGAATTPTKHVTLNIDAVAAEMQLSNLPLTGSETWLPYSLTFAWELASGPGIKTVYLKIRNDFFGEASTSDQTEPAPLNPSLVIAGGSQLTSTRNVPLRITANRAVQMQISNAPFSGNEEWIIFADSMRWDLSSGAGTKTVHVKVRNDFLIESETNDQIDPAPLNPSLIIAGGATQTPIRQVSLVLNATGATQMQISNEPIVDNAQWLPFADSSQWELSIGSGIKTVYVRVRNDFLIEDSTNDQIEPAQIHPSLNILPDSLFINHLNVVLRMPGTDASAMKIANLPDSSGIGWQPYQAEIPWTLTTGDGWKKVYVWFRNDFYEEPPALDSVAYDTRITLSSFEWFSTNEDTLVPGDSIDIQLQTAPDAFGDETCGVAAVIVEGWSPIILADKLNGTYALRYLISAETPGANNARITATFIDRAHNLSQTLESDRRLTIRAAGTEREFPLGNTGQTITMVWIPASSFQMGSPDGEQDRSSDEGPVRTVRFARGFWMGKYEVTQGQWQTVMGSNPSSRYGVGADFPVYSISWEDIQAFEGQLGGTFRLPSEAEWEYACRAGTRTRFYWGDDLAGNQAGNFAWNEGNSGSASHLVGQKTANSWGLHDMSGNVWEWIEDSHHENYTGAPEDGSAWTTGGSGRVLRGGSWSTTSSNCRSANRLRLLADDRYYVAGFRLVYNER